MLRRSCVTGPGQFRGIKRAKSQLKPWGLISEKAAQILMTLVAFFNSLSCEVLKATILHQIQQGNLAGYRGEKSVYIKKKKSVQLLQENRKSEKAVDGLICSLAASEDLSHAFS